jgi:hypothetical protein
MTFEQIDFHETWLDVAVRNKGVSASNLGIDIVYSEVVIFLSRSEQML